MLKLKWIRIYLYLIWALPRFGMLELAAAHCCGLNLRSLHVPGPGKTEAHECFISCNQREECMLPVPRFLGRHRRKPVSSLWKSWTRVPPAPRPLSQPAFLSGERCWHANQPPPFTCSLLLFSLALWSWKKRAHVEKKQALMENYY